MNKFNNNYYNILNEGTPAPSSTEPPTGSATPNTDLHSEAFNNSMVKMLIQKRKADNIAVDIILPSAFNAPIRFPAAPLDLRNLLKSEKFLEQFVNGHGMMADPVSTYNHAEDIAKLCFEHANKFVSSLKKQTQKEFGGEKGKLSRNKNEIDLERHENESIYYFNGKEYNFLNESVTSSGVTVGKCISKIGFCTLGFLSGAAAGATSLLLTCYLGGEAAGAAFAQVSHDRPFGDTNDNDIINSNLITKQEVSDESWHGDNVIEAVQSYVIQLADHVDELMGYMNSELPADKHIKSKILKYFSADDDQIKDFLEKNIGIIKEIRKANQETEAERDNRDLKKLKKKLEFTSTLTSAICKEQSTENQQVLIKILEYINGNSINDSLSNKLYPIIDLIENDNINGAIEKAKTTLNIIRKNESYQYNYNSVLNEDNGSVNERPKIDGTKLYNLYLSEFSDMIQGMWPKSFKDSDNIKEAKAAMDKLQTRIDTEIKEKIPIICRTTNDDKSTTLSSRIRGFFSKHPIQEKSLLSIWEQHSTELDMRKSNRLKQMTNFADRTRVLGWYGYILKNIVPEVFARILTYRHILVFLKQQNIYTYTPEMYKKDEDEIKRNLDVYMAEPINMLLMYFVLFSHYWTNNNEPFIKANQNGGYIIDNNVQLTYFSFLLINCTSGFEANGMRSIAPASVYLFKEIYDKHITDAEEFVKIFISYCSVNGNDKVKQWLTKILDGRLNNEDNVIDKYFKNTKLLEEVKDKVDKTYKEIKNTIKNAGEINNNEISYTYYILTKVGKKTFVDNIRTNFDKLKTIVSKYKDELSNNEKIDIKNEIKAIIDSSNEFKYNTINKDDIEIEDFEIIFNPLYDTDKWAYIYTIFDTLEEIREIEGTGLGSGTDKDSINAICDVTLSYVKILTSKILTIGEDISSESLLLEQLRDAYQALDSNDKDGLNTFAKCVYLNSDNPLENEDKYNTAAKSLEDKQYKKAIDKIKDYIEHPTMGYQLPTSPDNGVNDKIKVLIDLLDSDNTGKIVDISKFKSNTIAILFKIITDSMTTATEFTKELLAEKLKDSTFYDDKTPARFFDYIYNNYQEAKNGIEEIEKLGSNATDEQKSLGETLKKFLSTLPKQLIKDYNNKVADEFKININFWTLCHMLTKSSDPDAFCGNINSVKFDGQPLSVIEKANPNKKYEIACKLIDNLKTAIEKNTLWQKYCETLNA